MKKVLITVMTSIILLSSNVAPVYATSLDEVVNTPVQESTENTGNESSTVSDSTSSYVSADEFINNTKDAANLATVNVSGANKVNEGIKNFAAFIVKVLSYFLIAFLVVRIMLDLVYIALPFTRNLLGKGSSIPQSAGGGQQPGLGGMGGMNSGFGGISSGFGGMNSSFGGMNSGMNRPGTPQAGAGNTTGTQWVSLAAMRAVADVSEGKATSPYKLYAKDMVVVLVVTPLLLTLAITGVLTNLGFLIGDVIAKSIVNLGGML